MAFAHLLQSQAGLYAQRLGRPVQLRRVLVRETSKPRAGGVLPSALVTNDPEAFFATDDMPIVIEVAGTPGVAEYFRRALSMGKHVVTANKSLLADHGADLFALAHQNDVSIAFEASCGGGIPMVTALQFGLMANRIDALYGILNGTSNYILTAMTQQGQLYGEALRDAQERGFAEADPTFDVSGYDAAQKLAILASLAFGVQVTGSQVACEGVDKIEGIDIKYGAELNYDIKLLAIAQRGCQIRDTVSEEVVSGGGSAISLRVQPCFVHVNQLLAKVHGSFNALSVYGDAVGHTMYYGRGAGSLPTASAVISDLINVASGWYRAAFASMNLWSDGHKPAVVLHAKELESRFYLRINAKDTPGVMAKVSAILGDAGISLSAIRQRETVSGELVPVVITTHEAREGAVREALDVIGRLDAISGSPVCIRIVDMPHD